MSELVQRHTDDGVAILELCNPPVNAVTAALRAALLAALERALEAPEVSEIVIAASGRTFSAGLDPAEIGSAGAEQAPTLATLCRAIEAAPKPVIAAVHGQALSGGLEIVLAAHYRIAHQAAQIAMPEVQLGIPPRGGATQRLPRLLGAEDALDLLLSGRLATVRRAPAQSLFDRVVDGDLPRAAMKFCRELREKGAGPRPTAGRTRGLRDPMAYQAAVAAARERISGRPEAALEEILGCVEAAQLLPFEAGLAREADAFAALAGSEQAQALAHVYKAERRAARPPQSAAAAAAGLPALTRIAVLGGGPLATQIVVSALDHGLGVNWGTRDPDMLRKGMAEVTVAFEQRVIGQVDEAVLTEMLDRLQLGDSQAMAEGVEVAIVAARGQAAVRLPSGMPRLKAYPDTVEGVALRFATPLATARLAEVLIGPDATAHDTAMAYAVLHRLGKIPVRSNSTGASVAGRMMGALQRAADGLVDMGEDPFAIDAALRAWGWPRPPFELQDLQGLAEAGSAQRTGGRNWAAYVAQSGREGRKSGRGFYLHKSEGISPDPAVSALIDEARPRAASPRGPKELTELLIAALANEGARMVVDDVVPRPLEIDLALVLGQAFPRWRGGPMMAADLAGLFHLKQVLDAVDHADTGTWQPHLIWGELIKNGRRFSDLNG